MAPSASAKMTAAPMLTIISNERRTNTITYKLSIKHHAFLFSVEGTHAHTDTDAISFILICFTFLAQHFCCRMLMGECLDCKCVCVVCVCCVHIMLWPDSISCKSKCWHPTHNSRREREMRTTVADGKIHVLIKI